LSGRLSVLVGPLSGQKKGVTTESWAKDAVRESERRGAVRGGVVVRCRGSSQNLKDEGGGNAQKTIIKPRGEEKAAKN